MAYGTSDGFKSTNRAPMMAHKRSMERGMEKNMGIADPLKQPGGPEEGGDEGSQVAEEHGPATEVHVMHNHEAGEHHVTSMHPDGHQHESMHGSVEEAHEHGKKLAGAGMQEPEEEGEAPEYE